MEPRDREGTIGLARPDDNKRSGLVVVVGPYLRARRGDDGAQASHADMRDFEARIDEAAGLARAIDLTVTEAILAPIAQIRPATYLGKGKVDEIAGVIAGQGAELVVMDCALSPIQQRNLEKAWNTKVLDRTGLILEIFGRRAKTKEGALQVELAHLNYQRSRLVRSWTHLERQRGGFGFMGGPGETQIEADRRLIGDRITRLENELKKVQATRRLHRAGRQRVPYRVVALVGYTNAGKSTLFNRLTRADVQAADMLFATLDPTLRAITLPHGGKAMLSDTVGLISNLPTQLVAAFRATLWRQGGVTLGLLAVVLLALHAVQPGQFTDAVSRVIQGVLTGVGFLGAGVIVRQGDRSQVHGLTSAACAFFAACVGIVCGAGHWPIALTALALAFLLLTFGRRTERWLHHALGGKDYPHNSEAVPPQSSEAGPHQPGK